MVLALALVGGVLATATDSQPAGATELASNAIVFRGPTADWYSLFTIEPDGGNLDLLVEGEPSGGSPAWSPDGEQVAFRWSKIGGGIFRVKADGTGSQRVTPLDSTCCDSADNPTWSADGQTIAFNDPIEDDAAIWKVNINGTGLQKIRDDAGFWEYDPAWSPDGTEIAFVRDKEAGSGAHIVAMKADGTGGLRNITPFVADTYDGNPVWSPDGKSIAFERNGGIFRVASSGGTGTQITAASIFASEPAWSPDGTQIAFTADPPTTSSDIRIGPATGAGVGTVVPNTSQGSDPAWRPSPLKLVGIEVTQVVQNLRNNVRLIERKPTWVRVYFESPSGQRKITAELEGKRGTTVLSGAENQNTNGEITARTKPLDRRHVLADSLNFKLPDNWAAGTDVHIKVKPKDGGPSFICREFDRRITHTANDCTVRVDFSKPRGVLSAWLVPVKYTYRGTAFFPTQVHVEEFRRQLLDLFPVNLVDVQTYAGIDLGVVARPPSPVEITKTLYYWRGWDKCQFVCDDFYFGLIAGQPAFSTGTGVYGAANDFVNVGSAYLNPSDEGDARHAAMHEVGHLLGFPHALSPNRNSFGSRVGYCNEGGYWTSPEWPWTHTSQGGGKYHAIGPTDETQGVRSEWLYGFSPRRMTTRPTFAIANPTENYELMSYCPPQAADSEFRWPSWITYENSYGAIATQFTGGTVRSTRAEEVPHLLVNGEIDVAANKATFGPLTSIAMEPGTTPSGPYTLRLLDASGDVLRELSFQASRFFGGDPSKLKESFSVAIRDPGTATRAVILKGRTQIGSVTGSKTRPTVRLVSPDGGSVSGSTVDVRWKGSDPDGAALRYGLQFSPDGGSTWRTMASDLTVNSRTIPLTNLERTTKGIFRVIASDGFRSAVDESAPFSVPNVPPLVGIMSPRNNQQFARTAQITFDAAGEDREGAGITFTWSSSKDGKLGTGRKITKPAAALSAGTHVITLTGKDAAGGSSTAKVSIVVDPPPPSHIVYNLDGEIFKSKPDGSAVVQLTFNASFDAEPDLSDDGEKIVWETFEQAQPSIAVMNADGNSKDFLTDGTVQAGAPSFSPDRAKVAYEQNMGAHFDIFSMDSDGNNQDNLTETPGSTEMDPTWSPDGTKIAYQRDDDIWVMNADGTVQTNLTNSAAADRQPSWGYGSKIVFNSFVNTDGDTEIYTVVPGGEPARVTNNSTSEQWPVWSPDATKILFHRGGLQNELYVMFANGTGAEPITNTADASEQEPDWGG